MARTHPLDELVQVIVDYLFFLFFYQQGKPGSVYWIQNKTNLFFKIVHQNGEGVDDASELLF